MYDTKTGKKLWNRVVFPKTNIENRGIKCFSMLGNSNVMAFVD